MEKTSSVEWSHVAMLEGTGSVRPCLTSLLNCWKGREGKCLAMSHVFAAMSVGRDGKCQAMSHVVAYLLEGTGREVSGHVSRRCCFVGRDGKGCVRPCLTGEFTDVKMMLFLRV